MMTPASAQGVHSSSGQVSQKISPAVSLDSVCQPLPDKSSSSSAVSAELSRFRKLLRKATYESMSTSINQRSREDREVEEPSMANCFMLLSSMANSPGTAPAASDQIFECRTRKRQFSSLQALGGHSPSHKRFKLMDADMRIHSPINPKIHECSICGLEFSVGQALGGHMSRHRLRHSLHAVAEDVKSTERIRSHNNPKVHECSICGLEFSVGQALGGHMSRHRLRHNLRAVVEGVKSTERIRSHTNPKVHECSICGLEFSVGQALGGHMSRHRLRHSHRAVVEDGKSTETGVFRLDLNLPPNLIFGGDLF